MELIQYFSYSDRLKSNNPELIVIERQECRVSNGTRTTRLFLFASKIIIKLNFLLL